MALVTVAVLWLGTGSPNNSTQGPTLSLNCQTAGEVGTAPPFWACTAIPVAPFPHWAGLYDCCLIAYSKGGLDNILFTPPSLPHTHPFLLKS